MDIKYAFLNGILEEVYIEQPKRFVDDNNKDMVCKVHKAHYALKQAPSAWYERFHKYLVKIGFERTNDNNNLYIKTEKGKGIMLSNLFIFGFLGFFTQRSNGF